MAGQQAVRDAVVRPGAHPLVVFSHGRSSENRRASTFLTSHLSSHGYVVTAMDHSEVITRDFTQGVITFSDPSERMEAIMANRVSDVRFLIDQLLDGEFEKPEIDRNRVGIVGHSLGGWTALSATSVDWRIRSVVALSPAGSSRPRPGILPAKLSFDWGRDVPVMYLAAENDVMTPVDGISELFERTESAKRMLVLRRADHMHFVDNVEQAHENIRSMRFEGDLAWIPEEMLPIDELCSEKQAHDFTRGLALSHLNASLLGQAPAKRFLDHDVESALATQGLDAIIHSP